jgi:hypothetical protein
VNLAASRNARIHRALLSVRVPITRVFHSRKSVFRYCVNKIVARLQPMWRGTRRSLRRAVRAFLLPRRRNLGFLGRIVQTLHSPAVAAIVLTALLTPNARAHERPAEFVSATLPTGTSVDVGDLSGPIFGDLDGDGDLDMLVVENYASLGYFVNTGSATAPAFAASTTLTGLTYGFYSASGTFGDIDCDGDLDLLFGDIYNTAAYIENTGTAIAPAFGGSMGTLPGLSSFYSSGNAPDFADMDADGDLDIVVGKPDGSFEYYQNTGSATAPVFLGSASLSGLTSALTYVTPRLVDLDEDGDLDIVAGEGLGSFVAFVNTGSAVAPAFSGPLPLGGLTGVITRPNPGIADLDGDGDLDVMAGNYIGTLAYYENVGGGVLVPGLTTAALPYGVDSGYGLDITFGDLDADGDLDMIAGDSVGEIIYYPNTGTPIAPAFAGSSTFTNLTLSTTETPAYPALGDIDGDGDLDVISGYGGIGFYTFLNTGSATSSAFAAGAFQNDLYAFGVEAFDGTLTLGDLDGDGDLDAIIGDSGGYIVYQQNTGTPLAPAFAVTTTLANVSIAGTYSHPQLADLDGDGDLDLMVGQSGGTFSYFENTGSKTAPAFAASTSFSGVATASYPCAPGFGDLDGDGDIDMFGSEVGGYGAVTYFQNTGAAAPTLLFTQKTGVSQAPNKPFFSGSAAGDLDGDGDLDLITGDSYGSLAYSQNTGGISSPGFASTTTLSGLSIASGTTKPAMADLDGDGDLDVVVGDTYGSFTYFVNTGTPLAPAFTSTTALSGLTITPGPGFGYTTDPVFGDLDGDGDLDAIVGEMYGQLLYFQNTGSVTNPAFAASTTLTGFSDVGFYSAPALGDYDGDGDLDLLVGEQLGAFTYYENTGSFSSPAFATSLTPSGLVISGTYSTPTFADFDADGDLDVISGSNTGATHFLRNLSLDVHPRIEEGDRIAVAMSKNASPQAFSQMLNAIDDLGHTLTWSIRTNGANGTAAASGTGAFKSISYSPNSDFTGVDRFIVDVTNSHGKKDSITILVHVFDEANATTLYQNFATYDNGSGGLTYSEAVAGVPGLSNLEFDMLDTGNNNEISLAELVPFLADFAFASVTGLSVGSLFYIAPTFADLDGDGDLDVIVGDSTGGLTYLKNTGSPSSPAFATSAVPTGLASPSIHSGPAFGDFDADGDLDALIGHTLGTFAFLENTGSATNPAFAASTTLAGLVDIGSYSNPTIADLDGDGDLDMMSGNSLNTVYYFENTGSVTAPAFSSTSNPFGLSISGSYHTMAFGDYDHDGDLDLLTGSSYFSGKELAFFRNTGSPTAPAFSTEALPSGLTTAANHVVPTFGDLDGDGDLDALTGDSIGSLTYFENLGSDVPPIIAEGDRVITSISKNGSPEAFSMTLNASDAASQTLTWGVRKQGTKGTANVSGTGTSKSITYTPNNNETGTDVFIVEVTDTDGDGLKDSIAVVVHIFDDTNATTLYQNFATYDDGSGGLTYSEAVAGVPGLTKLEFDMLDTGDNGEISFAELAPYTPDFTSTAVSGLSVSGGLSYIVPTFADLDGDGDLDVIVGDGTGGLTYLKNTGSPSAPVFVTSAVPSGLTSPSIHSAPAFGDFDADGDLDALIGHTSGATVYLENTGSASSPAFAASTTLPGLVNLNSYSKPTIVDLDADGDLDVMSGESTATVYYFENTGGVTAPAFSSTSNPFGLSVSGSYHALAFGDYDHDGDLDVLTGSSYVSGKELAFFRNTGSWAAPAFSSEALPSGLSTAANHTVPTLGDLDGDGDLDALTGDSAGNLTYFKNLSSTGAPIIAEGDRLVTSVAKNGTPKAFAMTLNASDAGAQTLSWGMILQGTKGTASVASTSKAVDLPTGTSMAVTYTPNLNATGTDVFIVGVVDTDNNIDSVAVVVHIFDNTNMQTLRDNFIPLDSSPQDGSLSLAESGLSALEFDAFDQNNDGFLSASEIYQAAGGLTTVYVNLANVGIENGLNPSNGFNTLLEGTTSVSSGGTVIISSGSTSETITISSAMTLQASGGTVTIGKP